MRFLTITLICFLILIVKIYAQNPKFGTAELLPFPINTEVDEIYPRLSNSGDTLFLSRKGSKLNIGGVKGEEDIWLIIKDRNTRHWSLLNIPASELNTKIGNSIAGIGQNGNVVYTLNPNNPKKGLVKYQRLGLDWMKKRNIKLKGLGKNILGCYVSPEEEFIIISMEDKSSRGGNDLYVYLKNKDYSWSMPINLGISINTNGSEILPFLSSDKRFLYFSSDGHKGFGDMDIFVSERLYDSWSVWSAPINLGKDINSEQFDGYFTFQDAEAYFSSNRTGKFKIFRTERISQMSRSEEIAKILDESKKLLAEIRGGLVVYRSEIINFEKDNYLLSNSEKTLLSELYDEIKSSENYKIILGYESQNQNYSGWNKILQEKRIERIAKYLNSLGLSEEKIIEESPNAIEGLPATKDERVVKVVLVQE